MCQWAETGEASQGVLRLDRERADLGVGGRWRARWRDEPEPGAAAGAGYRMYSDLRETTAG